MSNPNKWLSHQTFQSHSFPTLMQLLDEKVTEPSEIVSMMRAASGMWDVVVRPIEQERQKRSYNRKRGESESADNQDQSENPEQKTGIENVSAEG